MVVAAFDSSYYSTAAQIIPVVFLVAVVTDRWPRSTDDEEVALHSYILAVVLAAIAGEITALWALSFEHAPSRVEDWIVAAGMILPGLFVVANFAMAPIEALADRLSPGWKRFAGWIAQAVVYGTIYVAVTESFNPGIIFAILALPFFVGPTLAPLFNRMD
jgi:hypothetical protein